MNIKSNSIVTVHSMYDNMNNNVYSILVKLKRLKSEVWVDIYIYIYIYTFLM